MACMSLIKKPVIPPPLPPQKTPTSLMSPPKHCLVWKAGHRPNHQITQTSFGLNWRKYKDLQQTLSLQTHHSPTKIERFSHLSTVLIKRWVTSQLVIVYSLIQIDSLLFLATLDPQQGRCQKWSEVPNDILGMMHPLLSLRSVPKGSQKLS